MLDARRCYGMLAMRGLDFFFFLEKVPFTYILGLVIL